MSSDGRIIVGKLVGFDQVQNLILDAAVERVYSEDEDVEEVPLGLYVIRGDNICLIAEFDADKMHTGKVPAPLPSVMQQQF